MRLTTMRNDPNPLSDPIRRQESAGSEIVPAAEKYAATKKPKKAEKPVWTSVLFGVATGVLSFFINVLPEKISQFLSHVFSSMVKAVNPFSKEVE